MTLSRDLRGSTDWSYCLPLNGLANCKSLGRVLHARGRDSCTCGQCLLLSKIRRLHSGAASVLKSLIRGILYLLHWTLSSFSRYPRLYTAYVFLTVVTRSCNIESLKC